MAAATDAKPPFDGDLTTDSGFLSQNPLTTTQLDVTVEGLKEEENSSVTTPANTAGDVVTTENGDGGIEDLKSSNGNAGLKDTNTKTTSHLHGESLQTEAPGTEDQNSTQQEDSGLVEMASRASSDTISQTGSEPKEDVTFQQDGGLGKTEGQRSLPEDVGATRSPRLSGSPWDNRTSPLSFDQHSPVTPWPLETMNIYVDKMSEYEGEGRRRMLEERWLQLFQDMELRHQEHMLAQQEAHQRQIRHIQVQIEREMLHHQLRQDRRIDSSGKNSSGIGSSRGSPAKEEQFVIKPIAENRARQSSSATDIADSLENVSRQTSRIEDNSPESVGYNKSIPFPQQSVPQMQVTDATDEDEDFPSVSTTNTPKAKEHKSNGLHGQSEVIAAQWPLREPPKDPQLTKPLTTWSKRQQSVQQKSRDDLKPPTDYIKARNEEEEVNKFYPSAPYSRYPAHDAQILKIGENGSITEEFVPAGPVESVSPSTTVCSGFSYWKMDENDLYQKLPDDLTLNEVSVELSPPRGVVPSQPLPERHAHSQGTEGQRQPPSQGQVPPDPMKVAQMTPGTKLKTELRDRHEKMKASMADVDMTSDPTGTIKDPSLTEDPVVASNEADNDIRVNLREKHARHMADLRAYYEEEITELRSQLERANNQSPYKRLEDGNKRLRERCEHLEETLQSANGRIQDLEDTVQSMESKQRSPPSPITAQNSIPVEHIMSENERLRQKVAELEKALADANRHVGELESTLSSLEKSQAQLQSLNSVTSSPMYAELLQANNRLKSRCQQAEEQAQQSHVRIHNLESQLHSLQGKLTEWSDHYENTTRTVEVLQDSLEQTRRQSSMDADTVLKLETRNRQLEREMQETLKADAMRASAIEIEQNLMKKVVEEYGALGREHQSTKAALKESEDKLFDARSEVVEMKRAIGKLEVQLKQVEHENNLMRDKGLSPTVTLAEIQQTLSQSGGRFSSPTARRRWLAPSTQHNVFTGEPLDRSPSYIHTASQETAHEAEAERPLSPIIQAAIELDRRKHDTAQQRSPKRYGSDETSSETLDSEDGRRTYREPRYSPKRARPGTPKKNQQTQTPPKTGQGRVTDRLSGKQNRSPKKSLSPKFHSLDKENDREARFDVEVPTRDNGASLRRNLHFTPPATQRMSVDPRVASAVEAVKSGTVTSRPQWENKRTTLAAEKKTPKGPSPVRPPYDTDDAMRERMAKVRDVEQRFDELNEEKRQLESSLSRIPSSGPRLTRQMKLDQEALEDRLDKVVKELGSVRMTLRRYNVLRS